MLNETAARKMDPIEAVMELPSPIDSDGVGHRRSLSSQSLLQPLESSKQQQSTHVKNKHAQTETPARAHTHTDSDSVQDC